MQRVSKAFALVLTVVLAGFFTVSASAFTDDEVAKVQGIVKATVPQSMGIGNVKVNKMTTSGDTVFLDINESYSDVPFTQESVEKMKSDVKKSLDSPYDGYKYLISIAGTDINDYFASFDSQYKRKHTPFINVVDPNAHYAKGLDGNIIAIWQSHGWYFEPKLNRWEWQRARLFQTVEDLYTQSYVLPFLIPMLENAGAYVWDPRERDTSSIEVVVDNDGGVAQQHFNLHNNGKKWKDENGGFAYKRTEYKDFENPFTEGSYSEVEATGDKKKQSTVSWDVDMPEAGNYAIYISYKTVPQSVSDALYTINSKEGSKQYKVDQRMGGGVWVYLGHYSLSKGLNKDVVTLSNYSSCHDGVVTADAIKVGGGIGNIVRCVAPRTTANVAAAAEQENEEYLAKDGVDYKYVPSLHPRYTEGARYFLQWSGFPDSVYSPSKGINDYTDDYRCRGNWVNYLAGGSDVLPNRKGLNMPVDLSFAFHSDAGTTMDDKIIGTLGIYCTTNFKKYVNGTPRELSRNLTDMVLTQVTNDIRAQYEPNWTRRGMWDKSYYEARVPEVPAMLLELLSHENFADMKYGLDPTFRFTVCRAIYKGMLKFIASRDKRDYVIQPLPVNSFAIRPSGAGRFLLTWKATKDTLSTNSDATKFIVCERVGLDGGFKEIAVTSGSEYIANVKDNEIHSYKIIAMNAGGRSFPSEVLSLGVAGNTAATVMVVNGFTRVSAPDWFDSGKMAGFYDEKDHGVPYMQQINYIGAQYEFRRALPWRDDDSGGFGASRSNHETQVIAGNTFDYPSIHGSSIVKAGYSFVSCSVKAVEDGAVNLNDFKVVDLILGKQKGIQIGRGAVPNRYKAFTPGLIQALKSFTAQGGNVFVSGAYVATDIWDTDKPSDAEKDFAQNVLGYQWRTGQASLTGEVYTVPTVYKQLSDGLDWSFCNKLNGKTYSVESPDAIFPSDAKGSTFMRFRENNIPAGVASSRGNYNTVVVGFPFEIMTDGNARDTFMSDILNFFESAKH
jgi:hypothetical protein